MNSNKKRTIIICTAIIIILCAAAAIILLPNKSSVSVTEMLSTAQKYLIETDYERAIAEFNKVIELDPMNAEAYLGLAEAYEKNGQRDMAIEILEKGYEATGDARIKSMLELLTGEENTDETETAVTTVPVSETESSTEKKEDYIIIKGQEYSTELTELELRAMDLTNEDINELFKMKNLTKLDLGENQISDIESLSELSKLTDLCLDYNQINDIGALSGLTNLKSLDLSGNQINDISALSEFTNLKSLNLSGNQISDISALSKLINLEDLNLGSNQIEDISALSGMINLKHLQFHKNNVSDISVLSGLTNLESVTVVYNQVSKSDIDALREILPDTIIEAGVGV